MSDRKNGERERRHVPGVVVPFLLRELMAALTPAEYMVWSIFFLHANRESTCCLKNATIISECGLARNTFLSAKRGLLSKAWLESWGQRDGRGAGVYKVLIPASQSVRKFTGDLWDKLNTEKWWDDRLIREEFAYTDNQFDWLVSWRVIRALKDSDARVESDLAWVAWNAQNDIGPELGKRAEQALVAILRHAASSLGDDRGMWYLWGDGFDAAKKSLEGYQKLAPLGIPRIGTPGPPETGIPGVPISGERK